MRHAVTAHQFANARQAAAHLLHASAHCWQCSSICLLHWVAHAWHTSAHRLQSAFIWASPRAMAAAVIWQMSVHSKSAVMQPVIFFGSPSFKQALAHCKQAVTHSLQAVIHSASFLLNMVFSNKSRKFGKPIITNLRTKVCTVAYALYFFCWCAGARMRTRQYRNLAMLAYRKIYAPVSQKVGTVLKRGVQFRMCRSLKEQ